MFKDQILKILVGVTITGAVLMAPVFYAALKKRETYREYFSAQLSKDDFKYEQKIDDVLVYTKIFATEHEDKAGSTFWTKKRTLGAPYRFLIASLSYGKTKEPLIVTGAWLSIDDQPEFPLQLAYPLKIEYEDGDPGTTFRFASHSIGLDGILAYAPEREVVARVEYQQPGSDQIFTIRTRFESRATQHRISNLETILFGG